MPTYRVTDSKTGVTLNLTGDSPPTEEELEEIFSQYSANPEKEEDSKMSSVARIAADIGIESGGALAGAAAGAGLCQPRCWRAPPLSKEEIRTRTPATLRRGLSGWNEFESRCRHAGQQ